ncbi:MAG: DUF1353 domain-containing protein [Acidimicrobiales bacterium]
MTSNGFFDSAGNPLTGSGRGVLLRQTSPTTFELGEAFSYRKDETTWNVTPTELSDTDLASVPWPMLWFLPTYGRHTLAALLHDQLVRGDHASFDRRGTADRIFFDALGELEVPLLRRLTMWSAVTVKTRWDTPSPTLWLRQLGMAMWAIAALWGISNAIATVAWWDTGPVGDFIKAVPPFGWSGLWVSVTLPALAAGLWGRDAWPQGVAAIVPGLFVVPMSFLTAVSYGIYYAFEIVMSTVWSWWIARGSTARRRPDSSRKKKIAGPPGPRETLS